MTAVLENPTHINDAAGTTVKIARLICAPPVRVFEAWTNEEQLSEWWGPRDFTNKNCKLDVQPGGSIHIDMIGPDGEVYPMGGCFHEIDAPSKLVFTTMAFADEAGNSGLEDFNIVNIIAEGKHTRLEIEVKVITIIPELEEALAGMENGWRESIDRLEALVTR